MSEKLVLLPTKRIFCN